MPRPVKQRAAAASPAVAILVLEPSVARGDQGAVLALQPSTTEVRVQWVVPTGISAASFALSVMTEGQTLATNFQHGPLQLIDGSRIAEFHLSASVFAGHPANSSFLFIVAAKPTRATVSEFQVILHRN